MQEKIQQKLTFSFTDEFGTNTTLTKICDDDYFDGVNNLSLLLDEFKYFLLSMGYAYETVSKIDFIEE